MKKRPLSPTAVHISTAVSSTKIFAAAEFILRCRVQCSPPQDLKGQVISVTSADGNTLYSATLGAFDGLANECREIRASAPRAPGRCTWFVQLGDGKEAGEVHGSSAEAFGFEVLPHPTSVLVWGIKSAVTAGDEFMIAVALRCACGCSMDRHTVVILDHFAHRVCEVKMPNNIWPGSEAVYFAEVPLTAPRQKGRFTWQALANASELGLAHCGAAAEFELQVTPPPECTATVQAIDENDRTPLVGATVSMHPFRTVSDEHGMAKLRVPKGDYRLLVSAANHFAISRVVTIVDDCSTTAELVRAKAQNPCSDWDSAA